MKKESHHHESQLIKDLIREISEIGKHARSRHAFTYAFDPSEKAEKEVYHHNMRLMKAIHDLLNECSVNIKSRGYTYIKDAVCIIIDHGTLDVCLSTDIYPHIARKHNISTIARIEHNMRNSIDAAYHLYMKQEDRCSPLMERFDSKPTVKEFLLHLKDEVDRRLYSEIYGC